MWRFKVRKAANGTALFCRNEAMDTRRFRRAKCLKKMITFFSGMLPIKDGEVDGQSFDDGEEECDEIMGLIIIC